MARIKTVQDVVRRLGEGGETTAIVAFGEDGREDVSYRDLDRRCRALAGGLAALGVERGEAVAIFAPNGLAWAVGRLALLMLDVVCVPIDVDANAKRVRQLLEDSGAKRLLVGPAFLATTQEALAEMETPPQLLFLEAPAEGADLPEGSLGPEEIVGAPLDDLFEAAPDGIVSRFYTSGTTGRPKAVPLSHENIATNLNTLYDLGLIGPGHRVMLPLPLHHSYPFIVGLMLPLMAGSTVIFPAGLGGTALVQALKEGRVTTLVGVPRLYEALLGAIDGRLKERGPVAGALVRGLWGLSLILRKRLGPRLGRRLLFFLHEGLGPDLELLVSGGAKLDPDTWWRLEGLGWRVLTGYGLVETASVATFNPPEAARVGTAGRPPPGVEMRLQPVEGLEHEEIQFRGPIVFDGYPNDPEANAEAFTEDGWYRTGDLGWVDEEGFLNIAGRVKEVIVLPGGKNVAPGDVEEVYARSELIQEIAVLDRGERLVAVVVPDVEAARAGGGTDIGQRIRVAIGELGRELPGYMRVSDFVLTRESLPRNQLGKYKRHLLPDIYERAERGEPPPARELSAEDRERVESAEGRRVVEWLEARFPERRIDPDTSLQMDLGIDSLAWVELGMDMERRLDISLPEEVLADVITVRDLIDAARETSASAESADEREARKRRLVEAHSRWLTPAGPLARGAGWLLHKMIVALVRVYFRLSVRDAGRVPARGPLILAVNHQSDIDPLLLLAILPYRTLRACWWSGDAERVFGHPLGRAAARIANLFPADDRAPAATIDLAVKVLERERILVWFPEEWRTPDGKLLEFRRGIGALVARTGAPVLPVLIDGAFEAMPRGARFPKPAAIEVRFGEPIAAEDLMPDDRSEGEERLQKEIAAAARRAVAALGEGERWRL